MTNNPLELLAELDKLAEVRKDESMKKLIKQLEEDTRAILEKGRSEQK